MDEKFIVKICSDLDYEKMVADVSFENQTIAMITQENGIENMEITIYPQMTKERSCILPLNAFIEAIMFAKKTLIEMQKIEDS